VERAVVCGNAGFLYPHRRQVNHVKWARTSRAVAVCMGLFGRTRLGSVQQRVWVLDNTHNIFQRGNQTAIEFMRCQRLPDRLAQFSSSTSTVLCVERALSTRADDASDHNDTIAVREDSGEKGTGGSREAGRSGRGRE
jgi:hypothetical protein